MSKRKSFSIKNYVIILIGIFVISIIISNIFFLRMFENIKVNGPLYLKIESTKDLKADILPPRLYIVESYLLIQQILIEKDPDRINSQLNKIEKSRNQYFTYYEYWKKNIKDYDIMNMLIVESHSYVEEFFRVYDKKFIPALMKNDYQGLQIVANENLKQIFELHRSKIDGASILIEASYSTIKKDAEKVGRSSTIALIFEYIITIVLVIGISIVFTKKIKGIENKIKQSQRETEMANNKLECIIMGLRRFKHNYDNTIATVNGYIINQDIISLQKFIAEIIDEKSNSDLKNYINLDMLKDSGLVGLILTKLMYAERLHINFSINIQNEIKEIDMKISHLSEVLGILIDNAIEAASETDDKKVDLLIADFEELVQFEISNSINLVPDRLKMFEKGWSTKGENRGVGLWILQNILLKYKNVVLNTFVQNERVKQELLVSKDRK